MIYRSKAGETVVIKCIGPRRWAVGLLDEISCHWHPLVGYGNYLTEAAAQDALPGLAESFCWEREEEDEQSD